MHTILLIEDNIELLDNTDELLRFANYNVIKAGNGKEGLKLLKQNKHKISLILCDIVMSDFDGYDVLMESEGIIPLKKIPFVFISAQCNATDIEKSSKLGANGFLIKPFNGQELLSIIAENLIKSGKIKRKA
jgi:CheY-like chemotaxis protein